MMALRMMLYKVYYTGYFFAVAMSNQAKKLGDYPHGIARQIDNKIAAEQFKKLYIDKDLTDKKKTDDWVYMRDLYLESNLFGFRVELPDLTSEPKRYKFDGDKTIKMPMSSANGVGEKSALLVKQILSQGPVKSKKDLLSRFVQTTEDDGKVKKQKIGAKVLKALDFENWCERNNIPEDEMTLF